MHEPVFKHRLYDGAGSCYSGKIRHERRLYIRRKARIGQRFNLLHFAKAFGRQKMHAVLGKGNFTAGFLQFGSGGLQMRRADIGQRYVAAGDGGRSQIGAGDDAVRHDGVAHAV